MSQIDEGTVVCDIGCGAGLGTYLYQTVASKVIAVDYSDQAKELVMSYPHTPGKVEFRKMDLEKEQAPACDTAVAMEVIEHLANPRYFLGTLKANKLIFSVPLNSLAISTWHKYDFRTPEDVEKLIGEFFNIKDMKLQNNIWCIGYAIRK